MKPAPTLHGADRGASAWRFASALLLLAITGLVSSCGGGGASDGVAAGGGAAGGGTGGATTCFTGPAPAILTWDAVSDPNLAGYRIYYSTTSGSYSQSPQLTTGPATTTAQVTGLASGTTYYFVVTDFGSANPSNESIPSNEVCKTIS